MTYQTHRRRDVISECARPVRCKYRGWLISWLLHGTRACVESKRCSGVPQRSSPYRTLHVNHIQETTPKQLSINWVTVNPDFEVMLYYSTSNISKTAPFSVVAVQWRIQEANPAMPPPGPWPDWPLSNCKLTSLTSFFCCDHHNNKRRLRFNTCSFG